MNKKQKKSLFRILLCIMLLVTISIVEMYVEFVHKQLLLFILVPYVIIGYDILLKAFFGIVHRNPFDENFLMAIATIGALALGFLKQESDYNEAVVVMLLYQIGELFQSIAVGKSRKNIQQLMKICPDVAFVLEEGTFVEKTPDEVEIGSILLVKPGERIPLDGKIIEGESCIDTSSITGESLPYDVFVGDDVLSGTINLKGVLKILTTKKYSESTSTRIMSLIEDASDRKANSEKFIAKFAKIYTPVVCMCALLLFIIPNLVVYLRCNTLEIQTWLYRALLFLVVSCPCALVISIPLSFFACIGNASRHGILIKGANYIEVLSKVNTIVFDKTGTLTSGKFEVVNVETFQTDKREVLKLASLLEINSKHPIAKCICQAYGKMECEEELKELTEFGGYGIVAKVNGNEVCVGSQKLMEKYHIPIPQKDYYGTKVFVASQGQLQGIIEIEDCIKEDSNSTITTLQTKYKINTILLSGDNRHAVEKVCNKLGVSHWYAELLPEDKADMMDKIMTKKLKKDKVAFVGDGMNDAAAILKSDIGLAMGGIGSDATIEVADVIITDDSIKKVPKAMQIAKRAIRIVKENIFIALIVKFACLILSAIGIANMWYAIAADVGVMILAVLNSMRNLISK